MESDLFRTLLDLWMVSDPWPLTSSAARILKKALQDESTARGYADMVEAYHVFLRPKEEPCKT